MPLAMIGLVIACGGDGDAADQETPSASRTAPTATPTQSAATVVPEPTASISDDGEETVLDVATFTIPVCRTDQFAGGNVGIGTVPRAPTDSNVPPDSSTGGQLLEVVAPVTMWIDHYTTAADSEWTRAESEQDFASAIFTESRRIWLACGAASTVPGLSNESELSGAIKSMLDVRYGWIVDRLETLRTNPELVRDRDVERAELSGALRGLNKSLLDVTEHTGPLETDALEGFRVPNELLEITLAAPGGWLLFRNRVDIILVAPIELQGGGEMGFGVPGWNMGTALKVRRFQHESPWGLEDTAELMNSLLAKFGTRVSDQSSRIADLDAITKLYESPDGHWSTISAATVRDSYTYLFEFGCPADQQDDCAVAFRSILDGVEFTGD